MFMSDRLKENIISQIVQRYPSVSSSDLREIMDDNWDALPLSERAGPPLWGHLHWIASVADNEGKPHLYWRALELLQEGHPCKEICRPHIVKNLKVLNPMDASSCTDHCIELHNLVNRQLGKAIYPHDKAKSMYSLECDSCTFSPVGKSRHIQNSPSSKDVQAIKATNGEHSSLYYPIQYRARDQNKPKIYQSHWHHAPHY